MTKYIPCITAFSLNLPCGKIINSPSSSSSKYLGGDDVTGLGLLWLAVSLTAGLGAGSLTGASPLAGKLTGLTVDTLTGKATGLTVDTLTGIPIAGKLTPGLIVDTLTGKLKAGLTVDTLTGRLPVDSLTGLGVEGFGAILTTGTLKEAGNFGSDGLKVKAGTGELTTLEVGVTEPVVRNW